MLESDSEQAMNTNQVMNSNTNLSVPFKAQITLISVVLVFVFFILILVFWLRSRRRYIGSPSRRLIFASPSPSALRRALDPAILSSLPITVFRSEVYDENDCLECAVCLCDLSDGEKVRFLPKCSHGFHVECIDMWFHSNNTCPLCRSLVTETTIESMVSIQVQALEAVSEDGHSTNELNEGSSSYSAGSSVVSSSSTSTSTSTSTSRKRKEGMLVIDIPRGTRMGEFSSSSSNAPLSSSSRMPSDSPLPTSRLLEEIKSPAGLGRMRSFRRMLSSVSFKGVGSSRSPTGGDIEQGEVSDSKCQ